MHTIKKHLLSILFAEIVDYVPRDLVALTRLLLSENHVFVVQHVQAWHNATPCCCPRLCRHLVSRGLTLLRTTKDASRRKRFISLIMVRQSHDQHGYNYIPWLLYRLLSAIRFTGAKLIYTRDVRYLISS